MKRLWIATLATVLGLGVSGLAQAGECGGWGHGGWGYRGGAGYEGGAYGWDRWEPTGYCKKHGVKFSHGYYYAGKDHKHFTEKWYNPRFETNFYWDDDAHCPYYWCEDHGVFYPVRYIHNVGPDAKGPGPVVVKPNGPERPQDQSQVQQDQSQDQQDQAGGQQDKSQDQQPNAVTRSATRQAEPPQPPPPPQPADGVPDDLK